VGIHGECVVIRVLPRENPHIDINGLGLTPWHKRSFKELLDKPSGIILVTGPTGSGKTTTLYAGINYLKDKNIRIITAEDPVEYQIDGIVQGQMNPSLNITYADFIKAMMRQDPDLLVVGEVRDRTCAEAAIQCALTGHKVMTSFHTEDSTGALLRLMDMGIETFLISSTVVSVMAQRLVRVLCQHCKAPYVASQSELLSCGIEPYKDQTVTLYKPIGCKHCRHTGYHGRIGIHEQLIVSEEIRSAILERKHSSQIRTIAREHCNMVTLQEDGFYKALKGITTIAEIQRVAFHSDTSKMSRRFPHDIVTHCEDVITSDSPSHSSLQLLPPSITVAPSMVQ
jgi:type IV pilus assembly protein PilB